MNAKMKSKKEFRDAQTPLPTPKSDRPTPVNNDPSGPATNMLPDNGQHGSAGKYGGQAHTGLVRF